MNSINADQNRIFEQAMRWVDTLKAGSADQAEFFAWMAQSPRHVEEVVFALALAEEIGGLSAQVRREIERMAGEEQEISGTQNVIALDVPHLTLALSPPMGRRGDKKWKFAVAAGVAAIGIGVWVWMGLFAADRYVTEVGEQRTVQLDDGSTVYMNAGSRLEVRFDDRARALKLVEGEALFKVARDTTRPFRVHADETVIQALGTQFNVHRRLSGTVISVIEGAVSVSADRKPLAAGEEVHITSTGQVQKRGAADVPNVAAWRQHRLIFLDDTLADIAAEFNRHNRSPQIRIEGELARSRHFAGTFDADAPDALIEALRTDSALSIERTAGEIVISSR